jgi:hypothetical protein
VIRDAPVGLRSGRRVRVSLFGMAERVRQLKIVAHLGQSIMLLDVPRGRRTG